MTRIHDYRYDLYLQPSDPELLTAFNEALNTKRLAAYIEQDTSEPHIFSSECHPAAGGGLYEDVIEEELHDLAMCFPNLELHFIAEDLDNRGHGYELKLHGDLYQRADVVTSLSAFNPPVPFAQRADARLNELARTGRVESLLHQISKQTDYDLLYAQKSALIEASETGKPVPKEALDGLINFLDHMGDLGEALGLFQYDGIDPPFPMQADYQKEEHTFESEPDKTYLLFEEYEHENESKDFTILAASRDRESLRALLKAKVEKDEFGYFQTNGISESGNDHCSTNFESSFVSYYILEQDILTPEQTQALLKTPEYMDVFRYPDNFREVLLSDLQQLSGEEGYPNVIPERILDAVLNSKTFQAYIKDTWFAGKEHLDEQDTYAKRRAIELQRRFLYEQLEENPDWLSHIGAVESFHYPENLESVLHNAYYDVCRDHHLPVGNVSLEIEYIMRDPSFHQLFSEHCEGDRLEEGADEYRNASARCYDYLQRKLLKERGGERTLPRLADMLASAQKRKLTEERKKTVAPMTDRSDPMR